MLGKTSEGITPESLTNGKCSVEHLHHGLLAKMPDVDTVLVGMNMLVSKIGSMVKFDNLGRE